MLQIPAVRASSRMRAAVHSPVFGLRYPARGGVPLLVLALCACGVQVAPKVPRNDGPLRTSGYVGGVFAQDTGSGFGFRLQNEQSNETYVLEIDDEAVSLIAVPPGKYHVESWLAWNGFEHQRSMEQAFAESEPIASSFDVRAGQVMLLGEWRAGRSQTTAFTLLLIPITEPGAIRMLREAYPRFMDVPVQCLVCIP